jgi:hypothetical protein
MYHQHDLLPVFMKNGDALLSEGIKLPCPGRALLKRGHSGERIAKERSTIEVT